MGWGVAPGFWAVGLGGGVTMPCGGRLVTRTRNLAYSGSGASVVISSGAGVKQYVTLVGQGAIGVRADDGKFLWGYARIANGTANIPTPLIDGDFVFVSTGYRTGGALLKLVARSGGVDAQEVYFLRPERFQNHHGQMVLLNGHVYAGNQHKSGFPVCVELKTGKRSKLTTDGTWQATPHFSGDGAWLYFTAKGQVQRVALSGKSQPEAITNFSTPFDRALVGPNGKSIAFARGEGTEQAQPTDLAVLLADMADKARAAGTEVELRAPAPLVLPLRADAMRRCLTNLVDNARRHARHVWLAAERVARGGGEAVQITVDDDGPGIPPAQREEAFRPFVRLDGGRGASSHTGLGLTIARDIVRAHGGEIALEDSPRGGLRARVRLPA